MNKIQITAFILLASIMLVGCGPTNLSPAAMPPAPTNTPLPTVTPQFLPTSTLETATPEKTPEPRAIIRAESLAVFPAPDSASQPQATRNQGEELEVVGQTQDCTWLKIRTAEGQEGWVSGDNEDIRLSCKCSCLYEFSSRPENGVMALNNLSEQGMGSLEVENGSDSDGVIILMDSQDQALAAFYVRAAETAILSEIPDGTYRVFFSTGTGWSESKKRFQENIRMEKFESAFIFKTTSTTYPLWQVTLQPVMGGTAETAPVDTEEFPALE